jgi:hypothetical protein
MPSELCFATRNEPTPSLSMTTTIEDDGQESRQPKRLGGLTCPPPVLGLEFDLMQLKLFTLSRYTPSPT